eukprot:1347027-Amorphochlora_amoeboformis.AAC.3
MADIVQKNLEDMVPELEDLQQNGLFSKVRFFLSFRRGDGRVSGYRGLCLARKLIVIKLWALRLKSSKL